MVGSYIIPHATEIEIQSQYLSHMHFVQPKLTIVEPSCRCGEVVRRAPSCEESVVAQALDDIGSQYSWDLLRADGGEAAKRNAQERKRSKHDELADRYSNPTAAM